MTAKSVQTPLLDDVKVIAAEKGPEVQVVDSGACGFSLLDLFFHRSTYTWIAVIASFCHFTLNCIAYGVSRAHDTDSKWKNTYLLSGFISLFALFMILTITVSPPQKRSDKAPITAIHYYCTAIICAVVNSWNCYSFFVDVVRSDNPLVFNDAVRGIVTPLAIGFMFVAAVSCMLIARIVRVSGSQARGTELVQDPNFLVPAWHFATLDESRSCRRRTDRQIQLA